MPWWLQLIIALVQELPTIIGWIKSHPLGPKPALAEFVSKLQALTEKV